MNRASFLKVSILVALLAVVLLLVQSVLAYQTSTDVQLRFSEKVNLALRRTAHLLLTESGDSTSRIPVVQQNSPLAWVIRLDQVFNYERLPALLHESLALHEIVRSYDVAVRNCFDDVLHLGYNMLDFTESKQVPCQNRAFEGGCYYLQVTFSTPLAAGAPPATRIVLSLVLLGFLGFAWYGVNRQQESVLAPYLAVPPVGLQFGNSSLDLANQTLVSGEVGHHLTYREAKLLQLFAANPNKVLERDFILKSVWEDEGILVGRSLDVFVSRLRKILRHDPALRVVAVHGVGYRLEVASAQGLRPE